MSRQIVSGWSPGDQNPKFETYFHEKIHAKFGFQVTVSVYGTAYGVLRRQKLVRYTGTVKKTEQKSPHGKKLIKKEFEKI